MVEMYILIYDMGHDGKIIYGVFSTYKLAEQLKLKRISKHGELWIGRYYIREFELNKAYHYLL